MSIKYYYPDNHPTIFLESREDLEEIIDIMHTQAIDNIGEDDEVTHLLEDFLGLMSDPPIDWRAISIRKERHLVYIGKTLFFVWLGTVSVSLLVISYLLSRVNF